MRRAAVIASGVVILAWGSALVIAGARLRPVLPPPETETAVTRPKAPAPVVERRRVRAISPGQFASPTEGPGEALERIAPRPPLGGEDEEKVEVVLLQRPWSGAAGLLAARGRRVRLAGVMPTAVGRRCPSGGGAPWPCGVVARTQQRMLIRNRTVACDQTGANEKDMLVTVCRVGGTDIGAWLVRNGWAEAEPGSVLAELSSAARTDRRGIFGDDPREGPNDQP
ncbi:thermonuclease family protein [Ciceribacter sp. RN22]|uniref:thermonuclease family protein n=1 Tax=Ciceribacter sp. RN22 TaxID=2954932 RepID=UPI002092D583|nr:thermonuclease family protein [Ciceribacter sp. RN22]MCO6176645.1 thermonuclease family protein [Ciceribacter sp. RN22]